MRHCHLPSLWPKPQPQFEFLVSVSPSLSVSKEEALCQGGVVSVFGFWLCPERRGWGTLALSDTNGWEQHWPSASSVYSVWKVRGLAQHSGLPQALQEGRGCSGGTTANALFGGCAIGVGAAFWEGDATKHFSVEKDGVFCEKEGGMQWMRSLVSISTGKAIQWRGLGDSVNRRTLKTEKSLSSSPFREPALIGLREILSPPCNFRGSPLEKLGKQWAPDPGKQETSPEMRALSNPGAQRLATLCGHFFTYGLPNLWFAKPMVCMWVAIHENDGNHENDQNNDDNSDSYKQGVECWINGNHGNHGNDENHGKPGCKRRVPQITGLEIPELCGHLFCRDLGLH